MIKKGIRGVSGNKFWKMRPTSNRGKKKVDEPKEHRAGVGGKQEKNVSASRPTNEKFGVVRR